MRPGRSTWTPPRPVFGRRHAGSRETSFRKMPGEKRGELVPWDEVHAIVKIDVTGTRHYVEFLRFCSELVRVFAEFPRVRRVARDEEDGTRREGLDVGERIRVS